MHKVRVDFPVIRAAGLNEEGTIKFKNDGECELLHDKIVRKTKSNKRKIFSEEMLCSPEGIQDIIESFPQKCKFRGRGYEREDLKNMMTNFKVWAFLLTPGTAFPDVLLACERFGSKKLTRETLERMRNAERDRYISTLNGSANH
jgi:hypothetical protein